MQNLINIRSNTSGHHYMNLAENGGDSIRPRQGRKVVVFRHGERVDFTFNTSHQSWVTRAFDENGRYRRFDVNMLRSLPQRPGGAGAYATDTPLTEIGYLQAKLCGRALKDAGFTPDFVYASCAYRCVHTANGLLKGMGNTSLRIRVEPGLFEWGNWIKGPRRPQWLTSTDFRNIIGYPVDVSYREVCTTNQISSEESLLDYYERSFEVVQRILNSHPEDCNIVLVAHGASLETCSRQLTGSPPRPIQDFFQILHQTPYLASCQMREMEDGRWRLMDEPPILPLTHQKNTSYRSDLLTADLAGPS